MKRIINLDGGNYHVNIQGDYIQRDRFRKNKKIINVKTEVIPESIDIEAEIIQDSVTINTNGANFSEKLKGNYIAEILD